MKEFIDKNKNKLAASVAIVGLGATAAYAASGHETERSPAAVASVLVEATETVGGSDSDWEHGAAERAIKKALALAASQIDVNGINFTEQISELPTYDSANKAVEMANEDKVVPDEGDKFKITIEVVADSDNKISYEVTDAETIDIPNNQQ